MMINVLLMSTVTIQPVSIRASFLNFGHGLYRATMVHVNHSPSYRLLQIHLCRFQPIMVVVFVRLIVIVLMGTPVWAHGGMYLTSSAVPVHQTRNLEKAQQSMVLIPGGKAQQIGGKKPRQNIVLIPGEQQPHGISSFILTTYFKTLLISEWGFILI